MQPTLVFIAVGALLLAMALARSILTRLPVSTAMIYLGIGVAAGPFALDVFEIDPVRESALLERISELAVLVSLFASGLKLSPSWSECGWHIPVRLASISMVVTVALIAMFGVWIVGLPLGAAVLLGAVLAPTDPVLASDVQIEHAGDTEPCRFGLTGEAGLNDGTAFPFVMLGLGLLGAHELGSFAWRWFAVDLVWATVAGLGIGALSGYLVGRLVLYLRSHHKEAIGLDEFLALGLIALAYGLALLVHAYGFLAVFAAGLSLRGIEEQTPKPTSQPLPDSSAHSDTATVEKIATDPRTAPAYMTKSLLNFNTQVEHIGEAVVVLLVGVLLSSALIDLSSAPDVQVSTLLWLVPILFLLIRPVAVWVGLIGARTAKQQKALTAWFGIRGIGSIYYLMFAVSHGLPVPLARNLIVLVLVVVATSIVFHGISVTPIMKRYAPRSAEAEGNDPT
jgi:sodium/hydrogen antiporter